MRLPTSESALRLPECPPDLQSLIDEAGKERNFHRLILLNLDDSEYFHWDLLRRRPLPEGFSSKREWWLATKLSRRKQFKPITLSDTRGSEFQYVLTDAAQRMLHYIDLGAGGQIAAPTSITNPDTKDRYYVSSLIQEAITSSQLEGATTTRQIAKEMLRTGRIPRDRSERMVLNNFLAMKAISGLKEEPLTPETVLELHRVVTRGTLDDESASGRFRTPEEQVVVTDDFGQVYHRPPRAQELEARIRTMCDFANGTISQKQFVHPAIRAIILHFWLAYDHPFVDGNGRTARALFYWAMMRSGYWLFEFVSISQIILQGPKKYYRAFLYTETDDNDLTYFIHYHLKVIERSIKQLHEYIERKSQQVALLEKRSRTSTLLNHRQAALVSHAIRHPGHLYTYGSHQMSHGVTYQTARTDLLDLCEKGLLSQLKRGRKYVFRAKADLESSLEKLDDL